jgi:hypothetical protein
MSECCWRSFGFSRDAALGSSRPRAGLLAPTSPPLHSTLQPYITQHRHACLDNTTLDSPPTTTTRLRKQQTALVDHMTTDIQNLKSFDPFAEADDTGGETKVGNQQNYIHIRIQRKYTLIPTPSSCATPALPSRLHPTISPSHARLTSIPQSAMVAKP